MQHEWLGSLALEHTASRKERYDSGSYMILDDRYTYHAAGICVRKYSYTHALEVFVLSEGKHEKAALRVTSWKGGFTLRAGGAVPIPEDSAPQPNALNGKSQPDGCCLF